MRRLLIAIILFAATASAAVTHVDIIERGELSAYTGYERIVGKIHFAVDPKLAANRMITDIDLAPRNAQDRVEFTADLYMLKPVDPARGNGTALFEVSNRGGKGMLGMFDLGGEPDPRTAKDLGDPLLFEQGFTLVWVGWEWDVPRRPGMLALDGPRIPGLTGLVRSEIIRNQRTTRGTLGDRAQTPYEVADPDAATMTWRDDPTGPRTVVPRSQWRFLEDGNGVELEPGFVPGRIYEVIYKGKDPTVTGLGSAAIRDYISYLKQTGVVKRAIGFGTSQSGRFMRTFVYEGFNADERGARVFEGVWAHVGGAGRGSFNIRFGQPSRDGHQRLNRFYPTDIFPFSDLPQTDSGRTDSLLARATAQGVVPKIFYTNGSYEYWGRGASLIHTTVDGKRDFAPGPESRIYYLAGTQHGPNANPVRHDTENPANPQDYRFALRSLLLAMNAWITSGAAPPDSRLPLIARHELVAPAALRFPRIPGVHLPKEPYTVYRLDFGPDFRSKGIVDFEPPKLGKPFPILVPQVGADGNEISGVRLPEQSVPLATYTGWNLRDASIGAPGVTYDMVGSFLPFPRTRADREMMGDPRPSIEERYKSREDYLHRVAAAAETLVRARLLMAADVPKITDRAAARWDSLMNPGAGK
ncbi:MAG: alpha/beta hydrolase domain-containing protein [Terriglobia bacterium]